MKNLINLIAIAILIFATSCQKEETAPTTFPENPYNYVGEEHNQMVEDFMTSHESQLSTMQGTMEKEIFIFENILSENGLDFRNYQDGKELLNVQATQTLVGSDFANFDEIFGSSSMTVLGKTTLNNALVKLIEIDPRTSEGVAKVKEEIREIEIVFIEGFHGTADYKPAMTYLAVLKHSAQYWIDNPNGGTPTKAKWWQTLLADAAGAIIGGVLGGGTAVPLAAGFSLAVNTG